MNDKMKKIKGNLALDRRQFLAAQGAPQRSALTGAPGLARHKEVRGTEGRVRQLGRRLPGGAKKGLLRLACRQEPAPPSCRTAR